ncbi:SMI1/KNR4 family protein [Nonomuraea zeae]|uniref:SMI1/KNR4 family protein n=2 Tax=Nonomuraea zeae TaxID=1642303 RepID=A0A5S4G975_9ACTN|nr:SMI1/KNR4 family protein [Nonomuraea zeae]TMR29422.1 SMI1/KNR4 family protein [Nonomuraea zeae]
MYVLRMPLPSMLLTAIARGSWRTPGDLGLLERVFRCEAVDPRFYSKQEILSETERWHAENDPEILAQYEGRINTEDPPGDIVRHRSIIIGDLGPDLPFALDYRRVDEEPSVIFLTVEGNWREVAPSIAAFMRALKIDYVP